MKDEILVSLSVNPTSNKIEKYINYINYCLDGIKSNIIYNPDEYDNTAFIRFQYAHDGVEFVNRFFSNLHNKEITKESFRSDEFFINSLNQNIINNILICQNRALINDIHILDNICTELSSDITNITKNLTSLNEFVNSSGIIYYKEFMDQLLDVLDSKEVLNKEFAKSKMYPTKH